jgi:hypothetical protein
MKKLNPTKTFFTIKGYDSLLGEYYTKTETYVSRHPTLWNKKGREYVTEVTFKCVDEAKENCRSNEWVEEWTFDKEVGYMDNSSELIYRNSMGEEKVRPGMFAHGDLC